jgi:hypothetical protein
MKSCEENHCWHIYRGPVWQVLPDGHSVYKCCRCPARSSFHREHAPDQGYSRVTALHGRGRPYVDAVQIHPGHPKKAYTRRFHASGLEIMLFRKQDASN